MPFPTTWMSISEGLPVDGQKILFVRMGYVEDGIYDLNAPTKIYSDGTMGTRYSLSGPRFVGDRCNYGAGNGYDDVTHWAPYPSYP